MYVFAVLNDILLEKFMMIFVKIFCEKNVVKYGVMCVCECMCDVVLKFMCVRVGRVTMSTGACSSLANTHTDTDTHIGIQIHTDANVYRI